MQLSGAAGRERVAGHPSDMPFFRQAFPAPTHDPSFDHASVESDGFELILGGTDPQRLNSAEVKFTDTLIKRSERSERAKGTAPVDTPFSANFKASTLIQWHDTVQDPSFRRMCARGVELLNAVPGEVSLLARRTADAADICLRTAAPCDRLQRLFAQAVRRHARDTLQERIDAPFRKLGLDPTSIEMAQAMFLHAIAMKDAFGVFRAADEVGLDFILNVGGQPVYAFKPMTTDAPQALSMSRLHLQLASTLSKELGIDVSLGQSVAHLVQMPGDWSGLGEDDPQYTTAGAKGTLGLLMRAPSDFNLHLSNPEGADDDAEGRARLMAALTRSPSPRTAEALTLAALWTGGAQVPRRGALVDEKGRAWILQHDMSLREPPQHHPGQVQESASRSPAASGTTTTTDLPMRHDIQRALSQLGGEMTADAVAELCRPTERELLLIAAATGLPDVGATGSASALWPGDAWIHRVAGQIRQLGEWAQSCATTREGLLNQPADEVEALREEVERSSSLNWFMSTLDVKEDA